MADEDADADEAAVRGLPEAAELVGPDDLGELIQLVHRAVAELPVDHLVRQLDRRL